MKGAMKEDLHTGRFYFDPQNPIFSDHFPGQPVVPGSLVMEAFIQAAEQLGIEITALKRFRFKKFAAPGAYAYELRISAGIIRCRLLNERQELACGKMCYAD